MTTISVEEHFRRMSKKRFETFQVLLSAEIKARRMKQKPDPIKLTGKESPTENERDAAWIRGQEPDGLRVLEKIVLAETKRRSDKAKLKK